MLNSSVTITFLVLVVVPDQCDTFARPKGDTTDELFPPQAL